MAVVEFTRDGQGFFNFDALLDLTSLEFVDRVKRHLDLQDSFGRQYDVKISSPVEQDVVVYVIEKHSVVIFRYINGHIDKSFIMAHELKMLSEVFGYGS